MMVLHLIRQGFREIWAHKFRSLLSMTGIILGVASLVAMIGVVQGMIRNFTVFFETSGGIEKVTVGEEDPPEDQQEIAFLSPGLNIDDLIAVEGTVPLAQYVAGARWTGWDRINGPDGSTWAPVRAASPQFAEIDGWAVQSGRFIADLDEATLAPVAVIGTRVADRIFAAGTDPVGKTITIRRQPFTVIGLLEHYEFMQGGRNALDRKNRSIFIPLRTGISRFADSDKLSELVVKVDSPGDLAGLVPQLRNALLQSHNGIEDFAIETREEQLADFNKVERSFTLSLGGVAGISLLVGGIGIMNVMLAVISERIREIGVRKAVGARGGDIFLQFLAESTVISVIGGLIGLVLSVGFLQILAGMIPDGGNISLLPVKAMGFGFSFSVVVGICAGIYPALKAARLDPIEALRYE